MKKIITIGLLAIATLGYSQVIIGDAVGTATNKTSVLLEFSKTENKGIVLPYITNLAATTHTPGTIALDATTPTGAKVVYLKDTNVWFDLSSGQVGDVTNALTIQTPETEKPKARVIIGSETTSAEGVLVLESTNKAMVLPMITKTDDIVDPAPGMMAYIKGDKLLAVYNGKVWTFWEANP